MIFFLIPQSKDDTVVRLTNQVHEMELSHVVAHAVASNPSSGSNDSPGGPNSLSHPQLNGKLTSSGLSFDSDKFEFKVYHNGIIGIS